MKPKSIRIVQLSIAVLLPIISFILDQIVASIRKNNFNEHVLTSLWQIAFMHILFIAIISLSLWFLWLIHYKWICWFWIFFGLLTMSMSSPIVAPLRSILNSSLRDQLPLPFPDRLLFFSGTVLVMGGLIAILQKAILKPLPKFKL